MRKRIVIGLTALIAVLIVVLPASSCFVLILWFTLSYW